MSEVEALKKVIKTLQAQRDFAGKDHNDSRAVWTAWGILNCKIADLELALLIREPEEKKENE